MPSFVNVPPLHGLNIKGLIPDGVVAPIQIGKGAALTVKGIVDKTALQPFIPAV